MQTRAEHVDGGWALTGVKHYISNANRAQVIICMARVDDGPLTDAVSAFIVSPDENPGVRIGRIHDKLGIIPKLVASERCFDNARVALESWGGAGIMREHGIEKLLRDAAIWVHSDGTMIIMRLKIADQLGAFSGPAYDLWDAYPAVEPVAG
jgi:alkylation response protein AidB-like acyl-CoA dehydrogenase